ncbi:MAG: fibronectin type III domain-containing protein [Prevotella sp.]|nr:fibronectin type III domain-containing protein [Prevotella sp.]
MKKNRLLFLLLSLFMVCIGARADEVLIGDESSTMGNNYLPGYNFYNYSLTQQIYTAAEIGTPGTINSIAFKNTGAEKTRTYAIYMSQTDKDGFADGNDWVAVSDANLVFTGELTFTVGEWTVIQLDTPFEYDDGSNLLVTVADNSGNYSNSPHMSCLVFDASKQAIRAYRDASAYNVSAPGVEGTVLNVKNQIILDIEPPAGDCARPSTLTASEVTTHEATLTWEDGSGIYNVEYKTQAEEEWSPAASSIDAYTLTLEGLEQNTEYQARVQSVCDVDVFSAWKSVSFTTGIACPIPTDLTAETVPGDGTQATLSWTENGEATEWQICLNDDEENLINADTNPFTLTGLTPETVYTAKVRAIDGDEHSSWSEAVSFEPTEKIIIGSGTATSTNLPTNCWYKYSLSEQIYTAAEIGDEAGAILSIDFFNNATSERNRTLNVYMVSTDKETFSANTDWISVTEGDMVFSGSVTFAPQAWTTIEFDTPFIYNGTSNVALIIDDNTGAYASTTPFLTFTATGQALRQMSDSTDPDPASPSGGAVEDAKNQIRILMGEPPTCIKPTGLAVDYTGGTTAEVTWEGDADSYDIDVNGEVTEGVSSPYTLQDLELATPYAVKVRANCGSGDYSDWTSEVSFSTDICMPEDQCAIYILGIDSFGDGWNGASINVIDAETEAVLSNFTLTSADGTDVKTTVLNVCKDRELNFEWVSGTYDSECYFAIFDVNEEQLFYGEGGSLSSGVFFTYTPDCIETSCRTVTDLAVSEIGGKSVKLSWTENGEADAWIVAYKQADEEEFTEIRTEENPYTLEGLSPETNYIVKVTSDCDILKWSEEVAFTTSDLSPINVTASHIAPTSASIGWTGYTCGYDVRWAEASGAWLQYDNGADNTKNIGNSTAAEWTWGVMYPGSMVNYDYLSKIAIYENSENLTNNVTVNIYSGGDDAPGELVGTEEIEPEGTTGWHVVEIRPVDVVKGENLWITLTTTGTYVMAGYASDEPNSDWVLSGDSWGHLSELSSSLAGTGWMIRGLLGEEVDPDEVEWQQASCSESPYMIEGLEPQTVYVVEVRGNCEDEGVVTDWVSTNFTTPKENPIPINVEVVPGATTADISWEGYSDSYIVKYRTALIENPLYLEDFENGLEGWTIYQDGEAPANGAWYTINPIDGLSFNAHSGEYAASAWSWNNSAYNADNWLISPQLDLNGVLRFWERTNSRYPDDYEVLLSLDGTDESDFRETLRELAPSEGLGKWNRVSIDLSEYAGQQGYIAIHHVCNDMNYLLIDDFGLFADDTPAGEWLTEETEEQSVELTDLDPNTEYEYYIIGVKDGEENAGTEIDKFKTLNVVTVTIKEGFAGTTVASPYALDFTDSGLTVYKATGTIGTKTVYIDTEAMTEGIVPAEEGILVKGEPGTYQIPAVENAENTFFADNLLVPAIDGYTVTDADVADKTVYRYGKAGGKCGFQLVTKLGQNVGAGKAYLRLTEALAEAAAALGITFGDDETTGIDVISGDQLDLNAPMYNTAGQRVQKSYKGVVIQNGKKFIKK